MDQDLKKARDLLLSSDHTCVLCRGDQMYTSRERGVKPLLTFLDSGTDLSGFAAADKVVGRGAAFLYCLLGVRSIYAGIVSSAAMEVLTQAGIAVSAEKTVERIQNRAGDGLCPMESATMSCKTPTEALSAIRRTLKALQEAM